MRIYLATQTSPDIGQAETIGRIRRQKTEDRRLLSFFYLEYIDLKQNYTQIYFHRDTDMNKPIKIFLDSGAYSAWTQNVKIDIKDYIEFIKKYQDHLEVYANLDVIKNPEATYKNQLTMERAGLNPLPVFHYGSDIEWLKRYLRRGHDYIALGVAGNNTTDKLSPWLDDLFSNYLTDKDGMPVIKVHGFAVTNFNIMWRYPWYSVDSTSWIITGRNGGVLVPFMKGGEYLYNKPPNKINVSNRSPDSATDPDHITCMPKTVQNLILQYFSHKGYSLGESKWEKKEWDYKEQPGERWIEKKADRKKKGWGIIERIIIPGLSNDYRKRDELNIIYYADLEKSMPEWPWPFKLKRKGGFRL